MYFGDGYYMAGMHAFWWLFWLFIALVFVFGLQPRSSRRDEPSTKTEAPHEILRRRLANGEITREQYEEVKAVLDRDK
jgi:putative membrane protein